MDLSLVRGEQEARPVEHLSYPAVIREMRRQTLHEVRVGSGVGVDRRLAVGQLIHERVNERAARGLSLALERFGSHILVGPVQLIGRGECADGLCEALVVEPDGVALVSSHQVVACPP